MNANWTRGHDGSYQTWTWGPYKITKWTVNDRGNKAGQYMVYFKPDDNTPSQRLHDQNPRRSLEECKRLSANHAQLLQVRASRLAGDRV